MFASGVVTDESTDVARRRQKGANFLNTVSIMQDSFSALEACRLPVLAAIQGGCIGGGVDLVTACDMRYATRDAFVTIYETKIGMTADVGTFPRIVKLIPEGLVREMAYTGRRVSAEEARDMGLVNRVYDTHEDMLAGVMEIAREIAANAPLAVHGCKRAITYARDHSTQEGLEWIGMWNASMLQNDEIMEAMTARHESRPAEFVDLPTVRNKVAKGA
jgi:enoyl-CoA hydratase